MCCPLGTKHFDSFVLLSKSLRHKFPPKKRPQTHPQTANSHFIPLQKFNEYCKNSFLKFSSPISPNTNGRCASQSEKKSKGHRRTKTHPQNCCLRGLCCYRHVTQAVITQVCWIVMDAATSAVVGYTMHNLILSFGWLQVFPIFGEVTGRTFVPHLFLFSPCVSATHGMQVNMNILIRKNDLWWLDNRPPPGSLDIPRTLRLFG